MISSDRIDDAVREVHIDLWKGRDSIWGSRVSVLEVLDPGVALSRRKFDIQLDDELGFGYFGGERCMVAGTIDPKGKAVKISRAFSIQSQRFTAAHELGHALLHPQFDLLHRDVSLERSGNVKKIEEVEANQFAVRFLMPARQIQEHFHRRFGPEPISLNERTAISLFQTSVDRVLHRMRGRRDWSLAVARAQACSGQSFDSMHEMFNVSPTAMAIRLEELGLTPFA